MTEASHGLSSTISHNTDYEGASCKSKVEATQHHDGYPFILDDSEHARSAIGKYIETYAFADHRREIRWKGISLPYRVIDPNQQRVTPATITENKRLSEVLSYVMAQQEAGAPELGPVGKQRSRYTPKGKRPWKKELGGQTR